MSCLHTVHCKVTKLPELRSPWVAMLQVLALQLALMFGSQGKEVLCLDLECEVKAQRVILYEFVGPLF